MPAVLFGSISTLADTSELQRRAYNQAFEAHGLDWQWDREAYVDMLATAGGQDRVASYAAARGEDVDAAAIHQTKSETFQELLAGAQPAARAGVVDTIRQARDLGVKVGLVTTTSRANVDALLDALPDVSAEDFDVIVDSSSVDSPKPDPAAYAYALQQLGADAADALAIEDNVDGAKSAEAAGVTAVAFPNENTAGHDFGDARTVDHVDLAELQQLSA